MNAPVTLKLYEITDRLITALETVAEQDDPAALAATLDTWTGPLEQKTLQVAAYIKTLEAEAAAVADAERRMQTRRRALENRARRLRDYLGYHLERVGLTHVSSPELALRLQHRPPTLVIDHEALVPDAYRETVTTVALRRDALTAALQTGETVPGARLAPTTHIVIS